MTYHILRFPRQPEYAAIEGSPVGFPDFFMVNDGESCNGAIQGPVRMSITKKHKGMKLADFISNLYGWPIVNDRAKNILVECSNLEVYPLEILDQKGKPVKAPYWLAHPVGTIDCVDRAKSEIVPMPGEPDQVHTFHKLVLDESRVPQDLKLFRIKPQPKTLIIRSDLVQALRDAQIQGFSLWELGASIML